MSAEKIPGQNPEVVSGFQEAQLRLLRSVHDSYTDLPAQQQYFEITVQTALDSTYGDEALHDIKVVSDILRWQMFGQPDDAYPRGIVYMQIKDGKLGQDQFGFTIDQTVISAEQMLQTGATLDQSFGLATLYQERAQQRADNEAAIKEAAHQLVLVTPAYQLLQSFAAPLQPKGERPLTGVEYAVRESQTQAAVRERFGLEHSEKIEPRTEPGKAYRKGLFEISNETRRQPIADADQRAYDLLEDFIRTSARANLGEEISQVLSHKDRQHRYEFKFIEKDSAVTSSMDTQDLSQAMARSFKLDETLAMSQDLFEDALSADFVASRDNGLPYQEYLKQVLAVHMRHDISRYWAASQQTPDATPGTGKVRNQNEPVLAFASQKEYRELTEGQLRVAEGRGSRRRLLPREDYERDKGGVAGSTTLTDEASDGIWRIIEKRRYAPEFDEAVRPDLALWVAPGSRSQFEGGYPYILGYKLVQYNPHTETYGFARNKLGNPFGHCPVEVPVEGKEKLADTYEVIGLTDLAADVRATEGLDVSQLSDIVARHCDYVVPEQGETLYTEHMSVFKKLVVNGRQQVQCSVLAGFLCTSWQIAFGKPCGTVIGGLVTKGKEEVISLAGHAQAVFTHEGRSYVQDPVLAGSGRGSAWPSQRDADKPVGMEVDTLRKPEQSLSRLAGEERAVYSTMSRTEQLAHVRATLESHLRTMVDVSANDELYGRLTSSKFYYPAWQAVRLCVDATDGRLEITAAERQVQLLKNLKTDEEIRRQLGFGRYTPPILDLLLNNAQELAKFVQWPIGDESLRP